MSTPAHDPLIWSQISPYLDRALDLDPVERETWIAELTTTQPDMARVLGELLTEREALNAQGFLAQSPLSTRTQDSLFGKRIGAYTIERLLGRGGMGEVWLAARNDGRFEGHCAIKFLDGSITSSKLAERFRREGHLLARLTHPNIARLIDAGATESGRPYLALEHIDGERIDRYCELHKLSIDGRVRLFIDVVSAVAHAHAHLIIHRDLKPSNVLVTRDGQVKLLDFGIAKLLSVEIAADEAALTRLEDVALTPEYAAPEQMLGETPSTATDVYQLGMLLYVLLTDQHPVQLTGTRAEKIRAALDGIVPRASEVADSLTRKKLQGDLDAILSTALRKVPNERYTTAQALQEELVRYLHHEPILARRGATWYRANKFVSRHKVIVVAAMVVIATLAGAFAITRWQLLEARKQRESALASARHAEATRDFLQRVLSEFQSRGETLTTKTLLERSSTLLSAQYSNQPEFVSEMLMELATEYGRLLDVDASLEMLSQAQKLAQAANNRSLLAAVECELAHQLTRKDRHDEARAHLDAGMRILQHATKDDIDIDVRTGCMSSQARLLAVVGERQAAIDIQRQAQSMLEAADATRGTNYNAILSGLALDLMDSGRPAEALIVYRLDAAAHKRNGRGGTRAALIAEQNIAAALYRLGEVYESGEILRQLQKRENLNDVEDISVASIVNATINANRLERPVDLNDSLQTAINRAEKEGNQAYFKLASVELARTRLRMGLPRPDAEQPLYFLEAANVAGKTVLTLGTRILIESVRGDLDLRDGKPQSADERARRLAQEIDAANLSAPRQKYLVALLQAKTALAVGDAVRSSEQARIALRLAETMARSTDTSADVGEALLLLGRALIARDQGTEARSVLERASRCLRNGYGNDHPATREVERLISAQIT